MAGGSIFALRLRNPNPNDVIPNTGVQWDSGLRAIMVVRQIQAKLQTTVFFGDSLFMLSYDIGQLSKQDGFTAFLKPFFGKFVTGAELDRPPFAATPALYRLIPGLPVPPPDAPIATGFVQMLSSGFDPLRGFWIEFAGNYFLTMPIFKDFQNVVREGPTFKGPQGSGSSGSGVGGSGSPGGTPNIPPTTC